MTVLMILLSVIRTLDDHNHAIDNKTTDHDDDDNDSSSSSSSSSSNNNNNSTNTNTNDDNNNDNINDDNSNDNNDDNDNRPWLCLGRPKGSPLRGRKMGPSREAKL